MLIVQAWAIQCDEWHRKVLAVNLHKNFERLFNLSRHLEIAFFHNWKITSILPSLFIKTISDVIFSINKHLLGVNQQFSYLRHNHFLFCRFCTHNKSFTVIPNCCVIETIKNSKNWVSCKRTLFDYWNAHKICQLIFM